MVGLLLEAEHRPAEAQHEYETVLARQPRAAVAANNLAFLLAENKRNLDEALRLANLAVQTSPPPSESAWDTLAWVRRARGELAEAAKILEPRAATTRDAAVAYHLGVVYSEMGRKRDAATLFDKALKLAPNYAPAQEARRKLASG